MLLVKIMKIAELVNFSEVNKNKVKFFSIF